MDAKVEGRDKGLEGPGTGSGGQAGQSDSIRWVVGHEVSRKFYEKVLIPADF